ncbi:MAG: hypothetical protein ACYTFG_09405 [Planctomycetota bacterium]|jgi:hypothetical protein
MKTNRLSLFRSRRLRWRWIRKRFLGFITDVVLLGGLVAWWEYMGRSATADWAAFFLFAVTLVVWTPLFLGRSSSPVLLGLNEVAGRLRRVLAGPFSLQFGFDFRNGESEKPFPDLLISILGLLVLLGAAYAMGPLLPGCIALLAPLSATLLLAAVGVLWTLLLATCIAGCLGVVIIYHAHRSEEEFRRNPAAEPRRRRPPLVLLAATAASLVLSLGLVLLFGARGLFGAYMAGAAFHVGLAVLPRWGASPGLLVHRVSTGRRGKMGLFQIEHGVLAVVFLWIGLLLALSCGAALSGPFHSWITPISGDAFSLSGTGFLGLGTGVLVFLFLGPATLRAIRINWNWIRTDPAFPRRRVLTHAPGASLPPAPTRWDFRLAGKPPRRGLSDLDYDPEGTRSQRGCAPPLRRDLEGTRPSETRFLLDHFDYVTKRRSFYRGLERLMKISAGYDFISGGGFLLAPHHFFVEGLHRDDPGGEEGEARIVGPPFTSLWDRRTRQFLHEWLSALEVDIVYYEDAVKWHQLRSVLDQAFERYMKVPGGGPIQETHFRLLNGVRVFIEEMEPDRDQASHEGYQEPHFANLSRARVLMVFKDRGEEDEEARKGGPRIRVPAPLFG